MIISIGEILVDMIGKENNNGNINYESYIGGAPFNLACNIKKLGGKIGFVGSVGKDLFGDFLCSKAYNFNFNYLNINRNENYNTSIALVSIDKTGERKFSFLRNHSADYHIDISSIDKKEFDNANIIHIGSLMLGKEFGRKVFDNIFEMSLSNNKLISFDINYRDDVFDNKAIDYTYKILNKVNIIKFSEDELYMFTNENTLEKAIKHFNNNQLVFITLSSKGSACFYKEKIIKVNSIKVKAIDTTGAGDAFYAAILMQLDNLDITNLNENQLTKILYFANICGALTTTNYGAVDAFPSIENIKKHFI